VLAVGAVSFASVTGTTTLTTSGTGYNQRNATGSATWYGGFADNLSTVGGSQSVTFTLGAGPRTSVCGQVSFK
jgi:hypothetical protein